MLPSSPPRASEATLPLRTGATGWPVFALQSALNDAAGGALVTDGAFGPATHNMLRHAQDRFGLAADGVAGPATWRALTAAVCRRLHRVLPGLPDGLPEAFARGEGGNHGAAVNWSVTGGVDCGLWQFRVYGPPYVEAKLRLAFAPYRAGEKAMRDLLDRATGYAQPARGCPFTPIELAVLMHNWPWAAQQYYRYGRLPNPWKPAPWVPASLPASVRTYDGWAKHYVATMTGAR